MLYGRSLWKLKNARCAIKNSSKKRKHSNFLLTLLRVDSVQCGLTEIANYKSFFSFLPKCDLAAP